MNKTILLALAVALASPFAAVADQTTMGVPDGNCQSPSDWRLHDFSGTSAGPPVVAQDGAGPVCGGGSWDGDKEYASGGALLISRSGDGVTDGSLVCHGMVGHHPIGGVVTATAFGASSVAFWVAADASWGASSGPDCGDGVIDPCGGPAPYNDLFRGTTCTPGDAYMFCIDSCGAYFLPGADGAYYVFVESTDAIGPALGHIHL